MAKSAADKILDAALKNQINILKLSASEQLKAEKLLINLQQKTLNALLSKITRTAFQKKRTEDLYKAVKKITDESFSAMSASSQRALLKMGEYEVEATAAMINGSIGVDVITPTLTISNVQSIVNKSMIEGELMKDWWSKQADDFIKRFKGTMNGIMKEFQAGMIEGRTIGQMISAISPSGRLMGYTRRNVEAMVRTSFMQVASDVRQKMYEQNSDILQGTRWVSTLDMRTTQLCMALDGSMWDMEGKPVGNTAMPYRRPPAHWNCRSTTVPVTLTFDQLLKKKSELKSLSPGQRAAMDGPVSKSMDYGDWLKSLPKKDQVEILGKAKQELWEKGRLSLVDMIRKDGSPLTIKELRAKINKAL